MLDGIVDCFLCDAIKMRRRRIVVHQYRCLTLKNTADPGSFGNVVCQVLEGGHQAFGFHLHRVKPPRQVARQRDALFHQLNHFARVGGFGQRLGCQAFPQHLTCQRRARQVLTQAVMQLVANPALLPLADLQDLLLQPLAFGHLPGQGLSPLADSGLQLPVERAQIRQQPDHNEVEHHQNKRIPSRDQGIRIASAGCQVAANPDEDTQHGHQQAEAPPHEPGRQANLQQVEHGEDHLKPRQVIDEADHHQDCQPHENKEGLGTPFKSFEQSDHAQTLVYAAPA